MADRTYDLLIDTPENRKIAETLRRYNNIKDTNGQPSYLWKPPHISGQRNSLKGGSCCSECKMTGGAMPNSVLLQMDERQPLQRPRGMVSPYTQPPAKYILSGNTAPYPQFNSVELDALESRKIKGGGYSEEEKREITNARRQNQNRWAYAPTLEDKERGDKMRQWIENERNLERPRAMYVRSNKPVIGRPDIVLEGGGPWGAMVSSGLKTGAKYGAKYGAQAVKTGIAGAKEGAKIAVMVAKNPAVQAVVTEIAKDPDVQKAVVGQITTLIKGKAAENVVEETKDAPALEGGKIKKSKTPKGKSDGRAKRAEIVKQVMKDKGLKMIEASKYVKAHNLY